MLGGLSAGGGKIFGIRAVLFGSSTAKGITLSNATKAHPVVLFLLVSVCVSPSLCTSLFPLLSPSSRRFPLLPLPHALPRPFLLLLLLSLSRSPRVVSLSLLLFLSLSISPCLFLFSLSLSLAACRPPCCSCSGVNGPAKNPRGLRRTGESERATRPTWGEGSKTIGPSRPKSEARGPPAAKRRVKWKS